MKEKGPGRRRADELLADLNWHDYEIVLDRVSQAIPPGVAIRHSEARRVWDWQCRNEPGRPVPPRSQNNSEVYLIRIGQRQLARRVLNNKRYFERDKVKGLIRKASTTIPRNQKVINVKISQRAKESHRRQREKYGPHWRSEVSKRSAATRRANLERQRQEQEGE